MKYLLANKLRKNNFIVIQKEKALLPVIDKFTRFFFNQLKARVLQLLSLINGIGSIHLAWQTIR